MRWVAAIFGMLATAVGTVWLLSGVGYLATTNIICLDVCPDMSYGRSTFWTVLGVLAILLGAAAIFWLAARRS